MARIVAGILALLLLAVPVAAQKTLLNGVAVNDNPLYTTENQAGGGGWLMGMTGSYVDGQLGSWSSLGQTFIAPGDFLETFTFRVWDHYMDADLYFRPVIASVADGGYGSSIWEGSTMNATGFDGFASLQVNSFLEPAGVYAFFLKPELVSDEPSFTGTARVGTSVFSDGNVLGGAYLGGSMFQVGGWGSSLTQFLGPTNFDMSFQAEFTTTPEPMTVALLGTGLLGLALGRRRKSRFVASK